MPPTLQELGIDRLSPDDRLALAEAIWDSLAQEAEQPSLSEAQRRELERRLADSPEAMTPWELIKARALARARRNQGLMTPEAFDTTLRSFVRQKPFQPFVIEMAHGQTVVIPKREGLAFGGGGASYVTERDIFLIDCENVLSIKAYVEAQ